MGADRVLAAAASAADDAWTGAVDRADRSWLLESVAQGADGTPTSRLDRIVEAAVLDAVQGHGVNVLSEEAGWIDRGSVRTLVIDPVDGTGNSAAGVPFSAFTAAMVEDDRFVEGLTLWLDTGQRWWGRVDAPARRATTGRRCAAGSTVSMIRPKDDPAAFLAVAATAERIRVLGSSSLEAALVADGVFDAFVDPGTRTHRIVDLAAAVVLVEGAGGVVVDVHGRPVTFTTDITRRWSGVAAATAALADELETLVRDAIGQPAAG